MFSGELKGMEKQVIAVCGKGGVGKTVFSALLAKALTDSGIKPLLLIDADPAGGLGSAIGEQSTGSLAGVRDQLIASARRGETVQAANQLDYLVLQSLVERENHSLLAMGHSVERGCFCPANELLRASIDALVSAFAAVLIDGEAGIEQINRDVTRRVTRIIAVLDGSQRSVETLRLIVNMVRPTPVSVVANRMAMGDSGQLPEGVSLLGSIPENRALQKLDQEGRPLWELPPRNEAMAAVRRIVRALGYKESLSDIEVKTDKEGRPL
jgi:CO dehydrogenase maturation factor